MARMTKVGALWMATKKDGEKYLSGRIDLPFSITLKGDERILAFKNKSENENAPIFDILIAEQQEEYKSKEHPADQKPVQEDEDPPF